MVSLTFSTVHRSNGPAAQVNNLTGVEQVAVGSFHSCARKTDGSLWCWGENEEGQLGDGTTTHRSLPVQVSALGSDVAEVALGGLHSCARKTDSSLWCWGVNSSGKLGLGMKSGAGELLPAMVVACGDGICQLGESTSTEPTWCAVDCTPTCGDGDCDAFGSLGETRANCPADCPAVCGNNLCETGEDEISCAVDCGEFCGNNLCEAGESCSSCPGDCGSCCTPDCAGKVCGDDGCGGSCGSCSGGDTCNASGQCVSPCIADGLGQPCTGSTNCCSGVGNCTGGSPSNRVCAAGSSGPTCGDGTCDSGEDCNSCAADCGSCGPVCGDGTCDGGEDCSGCPDDCGSCGGSCIATGGGQPCTSTTNCCSGEGNCTGGKAANRTCK